MDLMRNFLLIAILARTANAQGCSNQCPPVNYGTVVPSLCEGDDVGSFANIYRNYTVCHPFTSSINVDQSFRGKLTVVSNVLVGCNAGRRESGVFAYIASKYATRYERLQFLTSMKGGATCAQWANIYEEDAKVLYAEEFLNDASVLSRPPMTVNDLEFQLRDDFFTPPFGHPSYVIIDENLVVRHKFIGPCCGYESYWDCTDDIAKTLEETMDGFLMSLLEEMGLEPSVQDTTTDTPVIVGTDEPNEPPVETTCSVGEFSEWSACSVTCGSGIQFRWRDSSCEAVNPPVETRECMGSSAECEEQCVPNFGGPVATIVEGLNGPRDVAFHPSPGLHLGSYSDGRAFYPDSGEEAWVLNGYNHSVSIVASLGTPFQTTIARQDRGYYHYMINNTALAFNMVSKSGRTEDRDSFAYWAVCNDNRNTYIDTKEPNFFMGPTLYNSDPRNLNLVNRLGQECGVDEPCYFLHADMLHESPACIGITHDPELETTHGNVYWAFDSNGNGQNGQLVRFDFQQPHGPGSMDHSVASVRRFPDVSLTRGAPGVHAGMVVNPSTRELFIAVPGENKVIGVFADSGSYARTAREEYPIFSNRLPSFEYSIYECPIQRTFAGEIDTPSGMALSNNGEILFVAERGTGSILAFEISSGALLKRTKTEFGSIGGMSVAPESGLLYFVDQDTGTLNVVMSDAECNGTTFKTVKNRWFEMQLRERTNAAPSFSIFQDYACVPDPVAVNTTFFDQVHDDTGYASDNPDVQSMAGMDATAALLANRTDCGYDSDLNFDALLLGGYYCHQCLPGVHGASCDSGGICTNVQWLGYTCDNEFIVSVSESSGQITLSDTQRNSIDPSSLQLRTGVTYRFTVRGNVPICIRDSALEAGSTEGNDSGCAVNGPLLVPIVDDLPNPLRLGSANQEIELNLGRSLPTPKGSQVSIGSKSRPESWVIAVSVAVPLLLSIVAALLFWMNCRGKGLDKDKTIERDASDDDIPESSK